MDIIQSSEKANSVNSGASYSMNLELLRHLGELLPDQERVLGRDHPDTLTTLGFVGIWTIKNGDQAEGCRRLHEGLTRTEARFGSDHPLTQQLQGAIRNFGCE